MSKKLDIIMSALYDIENLLFDINEKLGKSKKGKKNA